MANTVLGSVVGQTYYDGGWKEYSSSIGMVGYAGNKYFTYILQFTTPEYVGTSESVTISFQLQASGSTTANLYWSLCTSDENRDRYVNTTSAYVYDSMSIEMSPIQFSDLSTTAFTARSIEIHTTKLKPSTTYYLVMWGATYHTDSLVLVGGTNDVSVSIAYTSGLVYIDNGSGFEAYQCYVDNGSSWDLCIPYIDNGVSWDMSG